MERSIQGTQVGILGGGQLSMMLAEAGHRLGLNVHVLTPNEQDPAAQYLRSLPTLGHQIHFGELNSEQNLREFFTPLSLVAIESEFMNCAVLDQTLTGLKTRCLPESSTLRIVQNKLRQKELLTQLGLPTSEFIGKKTSESPQDFVQRSWQVFNGECVFKWAELGYDGKGTCLATDFNEALRFCHQAELDGRELFCERKIPFQVETAIIGCLSVSGEFRTYPLVISEQAGGVCRLVYGPSTQFGLPETLQTQAHSMAEKLSRHIQLFGSFALEFFVVIDPGEHSAPRLMINEIAPRVHNSGHYTQTATPASQFENHWLALLGQPLGSTQADQVFAMLNFLGPDFVESRVLPDVSKSSSHLSLHWYGKNDWKPRRKLGHLNSLSHGRASTDMLKELIRIENDWKTRVALK